VIYLPKELHRHSFTESNHPVIMKRNVKVKKENKGTPLEYPNTEPVEEVNSNLFLNEIFFKKL